MTCDHTFVLKDGNSTNNAFKVNICSKCLTIKEVLPRGEAPQKPSVWDAKDLKITRMSVLKSATDIALREDEKHPELTGSLLEVVLVVAEKLEEWVYRPKEGK